MDGGRGLDSEHLVAGGGELHRPARLEHGLHGGGHQLQHHHQQHHHHHHHPHHLLAGGWVEHGLAVLVHEHGVLLAGGGQLLPRHHPGGRGHLRHRQLLRHHASCGAALSCLGGRGLLAGAGGRGGGHLQAGHGAGAGLAAVVPSCSWSGSWQLVASSWSASWGSLLPPVQLQLCLGVGEGAVVAAGTAAVLGQVAAQAGLVPGPLVAVARTLPLPAAPPAPRQLGEAHQPRHHGPRRAQPRHHQLPAVRSWCLLRARSWGQLDAGEGVQLGPQSAQLPGVPRPLQRYDQLLHALAEALRGLQLVDDALHVRLVLRVPVQQAAPLVGRDPQPRLRGDLHDLGVVLPPQTLVRPELFLQLHQAAVPVTLGHLRVQIWLELQTINRRCLMPTIVNSHCSPP